MAGIGFRLEKLLSKNSYTNLLEGYIYSAVVTSGPVLFTILSITILGILSAQLLETDEMLTFRTIIVYVYASTLILSSPIQMIFTRYLSDRIYFKDFPALVPAYVGTVILTTIVHAVVGYIAIQFLDLSFGVEITAVVFMITASSIWMAMCILSAAKDFSWILYSFAIGTAVGTAAGYYLSIKQGFFGLLAGFTIGQLILFTLLSAQIFSEFAYRKRVEFRFMRYFRQFWTLALISFFYNVGIWADKIVFWYTPGTSQQISGFLRASYIYDMPVFVSYLFIIPALAMFTIRIETGFYIHYKKYFMAISNKHPLVSLEEKRRDIVKNLAHSSARLLIFQGVISIIGIVLAPYVYKYLMMTEVHISIFQILILATFLLALLVTVFILILYFDLRTDALIVSFVFMASNIVLSVISTRIGISTYQYGEFGSYYGYGFMTSCLISVLIGVILLSYRLRELHFYTFASQKIITHSGIAEDSA